MEFYDPIRGKLINCDINNKLRYNLETGRFCKEIRKNANVTCINNCTIFGTQNQIQSFNNYKINNNNNVQNITDLKTDCANTNDIALLNNNIEEFTLNGYFTKAKVKEIIDGDTIKLTVFVDLEYISRFSVDNDNRKIINCIRYGDSKGYFTTFICRLYGINSMEKDTIQGQKAKEIMKGKYEALNNIVFCMFFDDDKYGRKLVNIYSDVDMKNKMNDILFDYNNTDLGVIVERYYGGTKSDYANNLPKKC